MLNIQKNGQNRVFVTCTEKMTDPVNDAFVFVFTHAFSKEIKVFAMTNVSLGRDRYDEFVLTDNSSENFYTGVVNLRAGQHRYDVFEVAATSPATITLTGAEKLLETGLVLVYDAPASTPEYSTGDAAIQNTWDN